MNKLKALKEDFENTGMESTIIIVFLIIGIVILFTAISIGITGLFVWLICWAFSFDFSWKLVIGIWAVMFLIGSIFKNTVEVKEK